MGRRKKGLVSNGGEAEAFTADYADGTDVFLKLSESSV